MKFDKNRNRIGSVLSILQYWNWFIAALTIRMAGALSQQRKASGKEERKKRVLSRGDGPLFSMRVHNLASSQQRARRKKRRTHYLCLSAFMDVGDSNSRYICVYRSISILFPPLALTYQISRFSSLSIDSLISRSRRMRFRSVACLIASILASLTCLSKNSNSSCGKSRRKHDKRVSIFFVWAFCFKQCKIINR